MSRGLGDVYKRQFINGKIKIFEEAEVLLLLELHNGMLQMRAAHRAENSI